VTGAGQYILTENRKKRNNGCGIGRKRYRVVVSKDQEKMTSFFKGGVFFYLIDPLMGDPIYMTISE